LKELAGGTVNVSNTKSHETAQAHSNQFPRGTGLGRARAEGPTTAFAPQRATARWQLRPLATQPVPVGGLVPRSSIKQLKALRLAKNRLILPRNALYIALRKP